VVEGFAEVADPQWARGPVEDGERCHCLRLAPGVRVRAGEAAGQDMGHRPVGAAVRGGGELVVPSSSVKAAERVPFHVRELLRIEVYEVTDDDKVCQMTR
jgi:hypothetical protein